MGTFGIEADGLVEGFGNGVCGEEEHVRGKHTIYTWLLRALFFFFQSRRVVMECNHFCAHVEVIMVEYWSNRMASL